MKFSVENRGKGNKRKGKKNMSRWRRGKLENNGHKKLENAIH